MLLKPVCVLLPALVRVVEGQWETEGVAEDVAETDTEAGLDVARAVAVVQMVTLIVAELERLTEAQGDTVSVPLEVPEAEGQREDDGEAVDVAQLETVAGFVVTAGVGVTQGLVLKVLEPERLTEAQGDTVSVPLEVPEAEGQREDDGETVDVAQLDTEAGLEVASADAVAQTLGVVVLEPERLTEAQGDTVSVPLEVAEAEGQRVADGVTVGVAQLEAEAGFDVAFSDDVTQTVGVGVLEPERLTEAHGDAERLAEGVAHTVAVAGFDETAAVPLPLRLPVWQADMDSEPLGVAEADGQGEAEPVAVLVVVEVAVVKEVAERVVVVEEVAVAEEVREEVEVEEEVAVP